MLIEGTHYRSIWLSEDGKSVRIIDQRKLPYAVRIESIQDYRGMVTAIRDMHLRGAPLIGAAAAYGVYLACLEFSGLFKEAFQDRLQKAMDELEATRPTAVNLRWAMRRQAEILKVPGDGKEKVRLILENANAIAQEDLRICERLGHYGADFIEEIWKAGGGKTVGILTHCNAGWLATVDYGTATAAIYEASKRGIPLHVWVDETRPRNQGALTSWELTQNGVPNTVICDNAGGLIMCRGLVDLVIVGTDRTALNGDVANKIGTYLKALAARDNRVPFYVALPSPSFDPELASGSDIPIEERDQGEVLSINGYSSSGTEARVTLFAPGTQAANPGFDVTPARLVTGYITEKGVFTADSLAAGLTVEKPSNHGRMEK